jgi:hypothetical protein
MLHAVQVRDMHTAVHNLLIYQAKAAAVNALLEVHQTETWPLHQVRQVDTIEINFRHVPTEFQGHKLHLINGKYGTPTGVPDCF